MRLQGWGQARSEELQEMRSWIQGALFSWKGEGFYGSLVGAGGWEAQQEALEPKGLLGGQADGVEEHSEGQGGDVVAVRDQGHRSRDWLGSIGQGQRAPLSRASGETVLGLPFQCQHSQDGSERTPFLYASAFPLARQGCVCGAVLSRGQGVQPAGAAAESCPGCCQNPGKCICEAGFPRKGTDKTWLELF